MFFSCSSFRRCARFASASSTRRSISAQLIWDMSDGSIFMGYRIGNGYSCSDLRVQADLTLLQNIEDSIFCTFEKVATCALPTVFNLTWSAGLAAQRAAGGLTAVGWRPGNEQEGSFGAGTRRCHPFSMHSISAIPSLRPMSTATIFCVSSDAGTTET